jgi:hypothetical protein
MRFRLGGPDGGLLFAVRDLAVRRYVALTDEENSVGAGNTLIGRAFDAYALGETTEVVGHAAEPQRLVGAGEQETVVEGLTRVGVDDGVAPGVGVNDMGARFA